MEQQLERPKSTPTYAHEPPAAAVEKPSPPPATSDFDGTLIDVLVTPKLTFKLPRKTSWQVVEDVPQSELQKAFLARFPVRFEAADLAFTCATPALPLKGQQRLVYRLTFVGPDPSREGRLQGRAFFYGYGAAGRPRRRRLGRERLETRGRAPGAADERPPDPRRGSASPAQGRVALLPRQPGNPSGNTAKHST